MIEIGGLNKAKTASLVELLTYRADDQPDGHRGTSPAEQFEREGFGAASRKVSKIQTARFYLGIKTELRSCLR